MKKVTISLKDKDVDELEVLLYSEYDACTFNSHGQITLYSRKACNVKMLPSGSFMNSSSSSSFDFSTQSNQSSSPHDSNGNENLAGQSQAYRKGRIVWAKSSINCPYWPSYVLGIEELNVHLYFISRSKFAVHSSPAVVEASKVIPYSPATVTAIMNEGLRYYKRLQLWEYMSDFYNAVLLAKTFISFKKRGYLETKHQIYRFFNSDLPQTEPKDSHTPSGSYKQKRDGKRSSVQHEDLLMPSKRTKTRTAQSARACESNAFQQRVYRYILTGKCQKHLHKVLNGSVACERFEAIHKGNMIASKLKSWREIYINPYFHADQHCDNVLKKLRDLLYTHERRMGSKFLLSKFFHLLYDVLYPEAIIEGIRKLGRLQYHDADMIYRNSPIPIDENDKSLHQALSKGES